MTIHINSNWNPLEDLAPRFMCNFICPLPRRFVYVVLIKVVIYWLYCLVLFIINQSQSQKTTCQIEYAVSYGIFCVILRDCRLETAKLQKYNSQLTGVGRLNLIIIRSILYYYKWTNFSLTIWITWYEIFIASTILIGTCWLLRL